jgi:hypothetical protein
MKINWTIEWMKTSAENVDGLSGVVTSAGWRCTATDTAQSDAYGEALFAPVDASEFTQYKELTKDEVMSWVWESVSREDIEKMLVDRVNQMQSPIDEVSPLPWNN